MTSADQGVTDARGTAEEFVRTHLATALGGQRGMLEAGIPTAAFTIVFLSTHNLIAAVSSGAGLAAVALVIRIVQRSSVQFVLNAAFGIGLGAFFAYLAARRGGSANDQALAYFLPGILLSLAYGIGLLFTVIIRWPLVGFMIGGVLGDPIGWRKTPGLVAVCNRLTLCLALPCVLRVVVQGPLYLAGRQHWMSADTAVSALGVTRLAMGWPLYVATLAVMALVLGRSHTPLEDQPDAAGVTSA